MDLLRTVRNLRKVRRAMSRIAAASDVYEHGNALLEDCRDMAEVGKELHRVWKETREEAELDSVIEELLERKLNK